MQTYKINLAIFGAALVIVLANDRSVVYAQGPFISGFPGGFPPSFGNPNTFIQPFQQIVPGGFIPSNFPGQFQQFVPTAFTGGFGGPQSFVPPFATQFVPFGPPPSSGNSLVESLLSDVARNGKPNNNQGLGQIPFLNAMPGTKGLH